MRPIRVGVGSFTPAAKPAPAAEPSEARSWRTLGDQRRLAGDVRGADVAYARFMAAVVRAPELVAAAEAMAAERFADAYALLQRALAQRPSDAQALWLMGEVATRMGRLPDAERLLAQALGMAPDQSPIRYAYAMVLNWRHRNVEALAEAERLLQAEPANVVYQHLRASSLFRLGEDDEAANAYAAVLETHPDQALTWMSYGHTLKTIGRHDEAVAAYRRSLELDPKLGEAWWSLANLKTVRFGPDDLEAMEAAARRDDLPSPDRLQLHFALGKAREDARDDAAAFAQYEKGNAVQRARQPYEADEPTAQVRRTRALLNRAFFAARAGQGSPRPDPIFVLGMPRAGSTLVEQILASHSAVEGTQELPHLPALAARLGGRAQRESESAYPDVLAALSPAELAALGEEYLARSERHRRLGRPHFIDKLPNNWIHTGLIHLILPNAKIVDARRHPLGCGFSIFKQHFATGQAFAYDLTDIGRYYSDYVELMAHFDAELPGRVHRVIYERMVADPETEVRRLLDYCGLPFEPGCLKFYENDRAVRTASSEQVRRPIFTDAAEHWRRFEPWLDPLKAALGPVLDAYPDAPSE
ncbi:MAG: tetratricopeptide repeat protein [Phenylobacterium sp.]|nr:tetratricopeptide repeat protein [Phenylobacterium sp.]